MATGRADKKAQPVIEPGAEQELSPEAEAKPPSRRAPRKVTAKDEEDFFRNAGADDWLKHHRQTLGWLGRLFGASATAATNIASFVAMVSIFAFIVLCFLSPKDAEAARYAESQKALGGLIASSLAYLFGAASTRK